MVEPAVKSSEWSTWAALRAVGGLLLVGAMLAGWFWATNGIDSPRGRYPLLNIAWDTATMTFIVVGAPMGYFWIRGRRRAEDEADRAGRSIKDAQDQYDARPRPLTYLIVRLPFVVLFLTQAPKLLDLVDQQLWPRGAVAGLLMCAVIGAFLLEGYGQFRRWRSDGET